MNSKKQIQAVSSTELKEVEEELMRADPTIFQNIPKEKIQKILSAISVTIEKTHSGPLPDHETLHHYNSIIPNGAERLMVIAEKNAEARIWENKTLINNVHSEKMWGKGFGFVVAIVGLCIAGFLSYNDHDSTAQIIGGASLGTIVLGFIAPKIWPKGD